ncbi:MAG: PTS fructose transporter subunit IIA [bacterium]|nr:PTS fructose transporter subunit IIA [bacterium]
MIGTIVVTHGNIGRELVRATQSIVRESLPMEGIGLEHGESVESMRKKIEVAMADLQKRYPTLESFLLLSDMFGGTPSNLCLSFLYEGKVEVVTGVNLPMLIKLAHFEEKKPLKKIAAFIKDYGQKNITLASDILKG